ncbi:MAG: cation-transporting P-type ATPase, partial [Anderseniella sp.]|nr:cation-transporting P-type ATPase [Anderseniella sp.]
MTDRSHRSDFHALTSERSLEILGTSDSGLSSSEAALRLAGHGPNRLPEPPGRNPVLRFLSHFHNVLIYVLLVSAGVTAALQHWVDTGVILAVVLVNAVIGFVQ